MNDHYSKNCEDFELLISESIDGEISLEDESLLVHHLNGCTSCRKRRQNFEQINGLVHALDMPELTEPCHETFLRQPRDLTRSIPISATKAPKRQGSASVPFKMRLLSLATLAGAALLATVLLRMNTGAQQVPNRVDIVGPMVSLSEINSERIRDQELLIESLEFDLRTLKLQVSALDESSETEMLGRIDSLMQKIKLARNIEN